MSGRFKIVIIWSPKLIQNIINVIFGIRLKSSETSVRIVTYFSYIFVDGISINV